MFGDLSIWGCTSLLWIGLTFRTPELWSLRLSNFVAWFLEIQDELPEVQFFILYLHHHYLWALRVELYPCAAGALCYRDNDDGASIGKIILPNPCATHPVPLRTLQKQNYLDDMTIPQDYSKPDLFITMTCNPKWREFTSHLRHSETAAMMSYLVGIITLFRSAIIQDFSARYRFSQE